MSLVWWFREPATLSNITLGVAHCIRAEGVTPQGAREFAMNEGTEIGLRIKEARIKAGLNRSGLAKLAGMSLAYVSLLEAGNIPAPTVDRLSRIAGALDTPLERIISESEYSP